MVSHPLCNALPSITMDQDGLSSRVICKLLSMPVVSDEKSVWQLRITEQRVSIDMSLDGEVLVWLPLPKATSKAVGEKIISAGKTATIDFFLELNPH